MLKIKPFLGMIESFGACAIMLLGSDVYGQTDTSWTRTYGGIESEQGRGVVQTTDGGYIITGWTASFGAGLVDVWLVKTDASGNTLWTKTYGGADFDIGFSIAQTTDGGYIVVGQTVSFGAGLADFYLIKINQSGGIQWTKT